MTDAELSEIRERVEKATPGPWGWQDGYHSDVLLNVETEVLCPTCYGGEPGLNCSEDDRDFIAAARTDVPRLLAEVDRLRVYIDALHNGQEPLMPDMPEDAAPREPLTERERERILTDKTDELLEAARQAGEAAARAAIRARS